MKYRIMGLTVCFLVLCAAFLMPLFSHEENHRYHQHLERPGYTACTEHGKGEFCSHLPLVMIETGGAEIPGVALSRSGEPLGEDTFYEYDLNSVSLAADGRTTLSCQINVIDHESGANHPGDEPTLTTRAEVRIRGNTSRYLDKKGYLIRATADGDREKNRSVPMLGMPPHHEWCLHPPYRDKALIRNYLSYNLAGEIMTYSPEVRFCEVFINGEYRGLYLMTETIDNGSGCRAALTEPNDHPKQISYIVRVDRGSSNEIKNISTFTQYARRKVSFKDIVYPGESDLTPDRLKFIRQNLSDFEKAVYSYDFDSPKYGWRSLINQSSFVDYYLIHEFSSNYEVGNRSTYIYKDLRGKFNMVIWDFDGAWDNIPRESFARDFDVHNIIWYNMLFKDREFTEAVIERYHQLRKTFFSEEWLDDYIDSTIEWLGPAIERDQQVWGYRFQTYRPLHPKERNPDTVEQAVEQMKEFIHIRCQWMDENIDVLRQYSSDSKTKKFNEDAN